MEKRKNILITIIVLYLLGLLLRFNLPVNNLNTFLLHAAGLIAAVEIIVMTFRHIRMDHIDFEQKGK